MTTSIPFDSLSIEYAAGVRAIYGAARGPGVAERAAAALDVSRAINGAGAGALAVPDPAARAWAGARLLAKSLTDVDVALALLDAASAPDEAGRAGAERSAGIAPAVEAQLGLLVAAQPPEPAAERGPIGPADHEAGRLALAGAAADALTLITQRAAEVGQQAVENLAGIATAQLAEAAGATTAQVVAALGVQAHAGRLYDLCRDFLVSAYEGLVRLLGAEALKVAGDQLLEWLKDIREGELFAQILGRAYGAEAGAEQLRRQIAASPAGLDQLIAAALEVGKLDQIYGRQVALVEPFLKRSRVAGNLLAAVFPQLGLFLAGLYFALGGYVILTGADFVDAPHMPRLDRVPGVRRLVAALAQGEEGR